MAFKASFWAALGAGLGIAICTPAQAADAFEDCNGASFYTAVTGSIELPGFQCEELGRRTMTANGQSFQIRVLKDKRTNLEQVQQYAEEILIAAEKSYAVYGDLHPSLKFKNASFVIMDPNLPWPTKTLGIAVRSSQNECVVRMFSTSSDNFPYGGAPLFQQTVAHEAFHCVQYATYPSQTDLMASVWWLEPTAELASHLVYPLPQRMKAIARGFEKLTKTYPLTQLTYEGVVFMNWLYARDPAKMFDLMAAMPAEQDGEDAQTAAFVSFIGEDDLQSFARDWVDGKIPSVAGGMLPAPNPPQMAFQVEDDAEMLLSSPGLAMQFDAVSIRKGEYMPLEFDGGTIAVSQRKRDASDWGGLPDKVGPEDCEGTDERLIVRMPTDDSNAGMRIQFKKTAPCEECVNSKERDKCLIGHWQLNEETMLTFLRARSEDGATYFPVLGTMVLVYDANGDSHLVAEGVTISAMQKSPPYLDALLKVEMNGIDSGNWSAEGGKVTYCPKDTSITYTTTIEVPGVAKTVRTIDGVMQTSVFSYQCSAGELHMTYTGPLDLGDGAPRWSFKRVK